MVLIASPMIKINDAAFLKKENNALNLEVYKLGQAFLNSKSKIKFVSMQCVMIKKCLIKNFLKMYIMMIF